MRDDSLKRGKSSLWHFHLPHSSASEAAAQGRTRESKNKSVDALTDRPVNRVSRLPATTDGTENIPVSFR